MQIVRLLLALLAGDVARDVVHRARAVERHDGDDVLDAVGAHLLQDVAHAGAFQLEHAHRVALAQHLVGLGVVVGNVVDVEGRLAHADEVLRLLDHRQRLEAEEVELHQPGLLDIFHVELGGRNVRARVAVERHQFFQRAVADDHAGGMGRGVAVEAFELQRDVEQRADGRVLVALFLQLRLAVDGLAPA